VLSRETMTQVLDVIRKDVAADKVRVDNPTQNLESYFLAVVAKAKQAAAETSGAQSGARVAAYLRGDAEAKPAAERVLERLTVAQDAPAAAVPVEAVMPAVDERKLEAMAKPAEPSPAPSQPATFAAKPEDLSKADEKLAALLGKKK
jgi:hypothetical protein